MTNNNQPLVSVFTPSHNTMYLMDCYESLAAQTCKDWEWIVLLNNGAVWLPPNDPRVIVVNATVTGVGDAKAQAVEHCKADILVELDHDDLLAENALRRVIKMFRDNPDAGLVYSHAAQIDEHGEPTFTPFMEGIGWTYKKAIVRAASRERMVTYSVIPEPTPHNVSHIWYAPNHLRAFSRTAYDKAGGYDKTMDVLDDQDLMSRLYLVGDFHMIDRCLYLQRNHSGATQVQPEINARIQTLTLDLYDRYFEQSALAWADRRGLLALDLGGAHNSPPGYTPVDQHLVEGGIFHTFPAPLPRPDSSVGVIRACDFLEHVEDKVAMMNEIHRLLAPGGILISKTPSSEGWGAHQDPTHVAFWNPNSFWYYTDPQYAAFVPEITARFQVSRQTHGFPSPWHEANRISYVNANLIAKKDAEHRDLGPLLWTSLPSVKDD